MSCSAYFVNLLSRREYSAYELHKKGKEKGFDESAIADALQEIQSKDYQSDPRLVATLIASSQGKYGKAGIKRKCLEKGIAADVFEEVWDSQVEETEAGETGELAQLKAKLMRKYHIDAFQNIDPKTKAKLINYLNYRGFNPFEVLQQWQQDEG
ncbi:regulatory protein RecX [Argonema antarcticum]|uniref:regulatory protein RecX n=1 Tax=Argonema antarcticum TaxID=2942763 RepID=UPI0020119EED|nr:regulatory protein RecX [Argonema antarcticum]MCL1473093.1 recombination regulator RecX [Argonema antarcticum A004/B2]